MDIDTLTGPGSTYEVFEPLNAWNDAPPRIYLNVVRVLGGVAQIGFDPVTRRHWARWKDDGVPWDQWLTQGGNPPGELEPPVPLAANGYAQDVNIAFSLALNPNLPAPAAFTVQVNAATIATTAVTLYDAARLALRLTSAMPNGIARVSYAVPGSNPLQSIDGVNVAAFADFPIER